MRVIAALALLAAFAAPAAAQLTVNGDAQAWREVLAAFERLDALRSYRVKIFERTTPSTIAIEVVNPSRRRAVVTLGQQGTVEIITVGRESRMRRGTGPWQCQGPPMGLGSLGAAPPDPKTAKGEVSVTRVGPVTIDGVRTTGYRVAYGPPGSDRVISTRQYVLVDGGLPRRSDVYGTDGKVTTTIDYYDFDAPITIVLPKCS